MLVDLAAAHLLDVVTAQLEAAGVEAAAWQSEQQVGAAVAALRPMPTDTTEHWIAYDRLKLEAPPRTQGSCTRTPPRHRRAKPPLCARHTRVYRTQWSH